MKRNISYGRWTLYWSITLFMVAYFGVAGANVGALAQACVPNPTNYMSAASIAAWQLNHQPVPVDQITITNLMPVVRDQTIISVNPQGGDGSPPPERKVFGPVIFFIIIIAVFAWIIYQVIKMMDKIIPPPEKPPPPPSGPDTNRPPIVVNPSGGPGPALADLTPRKSYAGRISTNNWAEINRYDIHGYGWVDAFTTNKSTYLRYWSVGMQSTTNMVDWESTHYRIDVYESSYGVYCNYYHYGTNWYRCYYSAGTNATPVWFNLSDNDHRRDNQFFRLADPEPIQQ